MNAGRGEPPSSRRELLRAAGTVLAAGTVIALEGCGGSDSTKAPLRQSSPRIQAADAVILNQLLRLEYAAITAYVAAIPLLPAAEQKVLEQFLLQEMTHAGELQGLVKEARAKPIPQQYSFDLGHPRTGGEALGLLQEIERQLIRSYLAAIPSLSPAPVRAAVASIVANDAQHLSMVRSALGEAMAPAAFVTGSE